MSTQLRMVIALREEDGGNQQGANMGGFNSIGVCGFLKLGSGCVVFFF